MGNAIPVSSVGQRPSAIQTILSAGLVAGCFDLLSAIIVYSVVMQRTTDIKLLQGIGRAAFGNKIFDSDTSLALSGVAVHFFIAFSFATFYFFVFPYVAFLRRQRILGGLLYGDLCLVRNGSCGAANIPCCKHSSQVGFNFERRGDTDVLYRLADFYDSKQAL